MSDISYPHDVARYILERWERIHQGKDLSGAPDPWKNEEPPSQKALERLIIICFQSSLLREEARPVTFRVILADPDTIPTDQGPPEGLHCLRFLHNRPFNPLEARRLSPAANFYRSLIGVCLDEKRDLPRMWGILHSGMRWLQNVNGGRGHVQKLPPALILSVTGPGRLTIGFGSDVIVRMAGGHIEGTSLNVFESQWMATTFSNARTDLIEKHQRKRQEAHADPVAVDPMLVRTIAQHAIRRLISVLRNSHHGATILILPPEIAEELSGINRYIDIKYRFEDGEPRRRFRTLIFRILNRMAEIHGKRDEPITWAEYTASNDEQLAALDEAIFEMAYLVAGCAEVDGAVVLTNRIELLGFGGEITGELPGVVTVRRALDLESSQYEEEFTESVGTRHRSAYRLCLALPEAVAIIISQDGTVRFAKNHQGAVTYWDQASTSSLDV